jgi:hypothetical protein
MRTKKTTTCRQSSQNANERRAISLPVYSRGEIKERGRKGGGGGGLE